MFLNCVAVGVGGFVGSVLRYVLGLVMPHDSLPWATLVVNVAGSFALGLLAALALKGLIPNERVSLMLRVGLCGGFTTMSTFSLEVVGLASGGSVAGALGYAAMTCALCFLASAAGGIVAGA